MKTSATLFQKLDLNLLRTFRVLLQERNARKTAERLFVTQPAISQALQKLRFHFEDELFVKVQGGLEPTPFALQIEEKIGSYFDGLETSLEQLSDFTPSELEGTIKIALAPIVLSCLAGSLFSELRKQAPSLNLELTSWTQQTPEQLRSGDVFIGIHYDLDSISKEIARDKLADMEARVYVRQGHPLKNQIITPHDAAQYEIASLISPGWNDHFSFAAQILEQHGYEAKVGFRSEVVLAIIDVVAATDMLLPHSNLLPRHHSQQLRSLKVELNGQIYTKGLFAYIHNKNRHSPKAKWLEGILRNKLLQHINNQN
ncbi:putative HTH-type transcriptional regulator YbdO [Vibrio thalassae]|uniref:Putative HTH-type transcriptional regulator YbdO n=1 Tax=Vibrio thalassae TaxID=1243014 RepID=A0A240EHA9_9VIBR|nr:LysR family transcriptional regulator [Vibrio thalassae]SNX48088.1 putative HTH-type transcriptional regulator YbdO [Vibrio thalassae]